MYEYIRRVLARSDALAADGRRPGFYIRTYGCQMNGRESEKLAGMLEMMGYARAARETEADLVLHNTCCVRGNAENKIFGNLSYIKSYKAANPALTVVVCGCMTQRETTLREMRERHAYVDVVFGAGNHADFPALLWRHFETGRPAYDTTRREDGVFDAQPSLVLPRAHPHKAGVTIMYGCDNFCAYCIVPYVRGRERSRPPGEILAEAEALAADGVKEIMLLGQNVNSYGAGLAEPADFASLLRRVSAVPGLARIRFMTSHPKDVSGALIDAMRDCGAVCKALHLPLQSGSTRVLNAMNRRYGKDDYLALVRRLTGEIPGLALSTDIIVGFPGETEEDFNDTLDVVRQARFAGAFTFIYSKRSGTPAADMPGEVPADVAADRFKRLTGCINPLLLERNRRFIGSKTEVMAETAVPGKHGTLTGRAGDHTLVHFTPPGAVKPGDIFDVLITEATTFYIKGEPCPVTRP